MTVDITAASWASIRSLSTVMMLVAAHVGTAAPGQGHHGHHMQYKEVGIHNIVQMHAN